METKRRSTQRTRNLYRIVGALLIGVMFVAAEAAEAKGGGKGGGGKGGGGDNNSDGYGQYLRELAKFDTSPPQYMRFSRGSHDDYLARPPSFSKDRADRDVGGCRAKFQYYDWITGTYVTTYSGRQRNCAVD